jgi:hypothetical protein
MSASDLRLERRAERLLRWYPRAWRARFGEEFRALLVDEMVDREYSVTRRANVAWSGLVARTKQAGMCDLPLPSSAQSRLSLGWFTAALATFLCFGLAMWSQLLVGWEWTPPDTTATTDATVAISLAVAYLVVVGLAALVPLVAQATLELARTRSGALTFALLVIVASMTALILGAKHFENGWPGTGGHHWANQGMVPGGCAAFVWAATLSITSYWAHPGALHTFPTSELAWMAASPLAVLGLVAGAVGVLRRITLPLRLARFELRCGVASLMGMSVFLLGAVAWLTDRAPRPASIPSNLFHVGAIDVVGAVVMSGSALIAWVAVRRGLSSLRHA